jgi:hypothetical protein
VIARSSYLRRLATTTDTAVYPSGWTSVSTAETTQDVVTGLLAIGVEIFLPFFESLSFETSAGVSGAWSQNRNKTTFAQSGYPDRVQTRSDHGWRVSMVQTGSDLSIDSILKTRLTFYF